MPGTTNGKAWSGGLVGAITVILLTALAQATGVIAMPDKTLFQQSVIYLLNAAVTFVVTYAGVWWKANFPRPPGEADRFMAHWAATFLGCLLALAVLAGCQPPGLLQLTANPDPRVDPILRATAVCRTYDATLRSLTAFRLAGRLSDAQADRVNDAKAIIGPVCRQNEPPTLAGDALDMVERALFDMLQAEREVKS